MSKYSFALAKLKLFVSIIVNSKLDSCLKYYDAAISPPKHSQIAMFKTCLASPYFVSSKMGLANFYIASYVKELKFGCQTPFFYSNSDLSIKIISSSVKLSEFLKKSVMTFRVYSYSYWTTFTKTSIML